LSTFIANRRTSCNSPERKQSDIRQHGQIRSGQFDVHRESCYHQHTPDVLKTGHAEDRGNRPLALGRLAACLIGRLNVHRGHIFCLRARWSPRLRRLMYSLAIVSTSLQLRSVPLELQRRGHLSSHSRVTTVLYIYTCNHIRAVSPMHACS
jgi:hypothetical protein